MNKLVFGMFISILIFSPLAFGTVERWSFTIMVSLSFLAFLLFFISPGYQKTIFYSVPGLLPLVLLSAFVLFQLVPLPSGFVKFISPSTYELYRQTVANVDPMGWISLSIHPRATLTEFFRLSSYIAFYVLTVQLLTKRVLLKNTVGIVIVFATVLCIQALVQDFTATQGVSHLDRKIFWFRSLTHGGAPFGPYVNRNHYAGWMGMILPVALGLFMFYQPMGANRSFREKIIDFLTQDRTNTYILLGLSTILISISIFLSLSRGGIVSTCLASLFLVLMVVFGKPGHTKGVLLIAVFSIVLLCVGWFGWEPVFKRFDTIRDAQGDIAGQRLTMWQDSLNLLKDFPLTGSGFGTFMDLYPKYRHFPGTMVVTHAHNDYIELLAEGGLLGGSLVFWFLVVFFFKSGRAFLKRNDRYSIYLYSGSLAGILSILIHSLTDFNLHIGANGLYFFFLAGLAVSAAHTRIHYRHQNTNLGKVNLPHPRVLVPLVSVTIVFMLLANIGTLLGELNYASVKALPLDQHLVEPVLSKAHQRARRASFFDPLEATYRYGIANIEAFRSNDDLALKQYKAALHLNPTRGEYLQRLAQALSDRDHFDTADKLYRTSVEYDPTNPTRHLGYAAWLLSQNLRQGGLAQIKQAIFLDPQKVDDGLTLMIIHGLSATDMQSAMPERVWPHHRLADFLLQAGNTDMAEAIYRRGLDFTKNEDTVRRAHFSKVFQFYLKKDRLDDALDVMQKAALYLPADPYIHLQMASLYERFGISYRAVEEYQKTLILDPKNRRAKNQLKKILAE